MMTKSHTIEIRVPLAGLLKPVIDAIDTDKGVQEIKLVINDNSGLHGTVTREIRIPRSESGLDTFGHIYVKAEKRENIESQVVEQAASDVARNIALNL